MFFIDGSGVIRAVISYPPEVGRSFPEIRRVIEALQLVDEKGVACPANWQSGESVIVPPPKTTEEAERRMEDPSVEATDWYLARKKIED